MTQSPCVRPAEAFAGQSTRRTRGAAGSKPRSPLATWAGVLGVASAAAGLVAIMATSGQTTHADGSGAPDPSAPIRVLRDAAGMRLEAWVEVRSVLPEHASAMAADGAPVDGVFTFASSGPAWRLDCAMDEERFPNFITSHSFDGVARTTNLAHTSDIAAFTNAGEPTELGIALPHPLFELAAWIRPLSDHNIGESIKLSTLQGFSEAALAIDPDAWTATNDAGETRLAALTPGEIVDGSAYVHRVLVSPDAPNEIRVIERVAVDGGLITRTEFDGWAPTPSAATGGPDGPRMPRFVRLTEYGPLGLPVSSLAYTIVEIEVHPPFDAGLLLIDEEAAEHHFDADQQAFVP